MDINDCEYDMLDLLAFNCNQLTVQLKESKNADEQEKILDAYLNKIDKEFEPINEIAEGLLNTYYKNGRYIIGLVNLMNTFSPKII